MIEPPFRTPHVLAANHRIAAPNYVVCVDTEAYERPCPEAERTVEQRFRLGTAKRCRIANGRPCRVEELRFTDPAVFWEWLANWRVGRSTIYLFAHSLGYDLTLLGFWERCQASANRFEENGDGHYYRSQGRTVHRKPWHGVVVIDDPPTILSWRTGSQTYRAVDTLNYWPMPLAELGRHVGLAKMPFPGLDALEGDLSDYCKNDTEILYRAVLRLIQWWRAGDYGKFGSTSASLAWSAYRHRFMSSPIHIHGDRAACELERAAYYGGRTECFYCGPVMSADSWGDGGGPSPPEQGGPCQVGPVHVLDVQSAYPSVMARKAFPYELVEYNESDDPTAYQHFRDPLTTVARVTLDTRRSYPCRDERRQVSWPIGRYTTTLAGPELDRAVRSGEVVAVHAVAVYRIAPLFREFVEHFWEQKKTARAQGDAARELLAKTVLNSLYGKFAQKKIRWEDCEGETHDPPWDVWVRHNLETGEIAWMRALAGRVQKRSQQGEPWNSFPAIAAYVTSYLRVEMDRLRSIAGDRHTYYQDTDSLHVDDAGLAALRQAGEIVAGELGRLRLVSTHASAHYYGLKHYSLDGRLVMAGLPSRSEVTPEGIVRAQIFERTRSIVARRPDGCVRIATREITRPDCHPHGVVGEDGWVLPEEV